MSKVSSKRVAVTGSSSGIGAATAALLTRQGWRVVCLDRNPSAEPTSNTVSIRLDVAVPIRKESFDKTQLFHVSFGTRF